MVKPASNVRLCEFDSRDFGLDQPLPGDLIDASGQVLVPAGVSLDHQSLEQLRVGNGGAIYLGANWPDQTSRPIGGGAEHASHIIGLISQQAQPSAVDERRTHPRYQWCKNVSVQYEQHDTDDSYMQTIQMHTLDISVGGIGLLGSATIESGCLIRIRFDPLPDRPAADAVVCHCNKMDDGQERVGARFFS